ncbi:MAG: sugar ABC transporter substrate-binding protein, partial [Paracoccus sp. (in: a-proteobacteria)]
MTKTLMSTVAALAISATAAMAEGETVGFAQIGSESGWRAAETTLTKQQAEERGYQLQFSDAQQKQENQIAAIRSFI